MGPGTSSSIKVFKGEVPLTDVFRATSATPTLVINKSDSHRKLVMLRYVNTDSGSTFEPMIWVVPRGQTLGDEHMFLSEDTSIGAGKVDIEAGDSESPVVSLGYGDTVYMASISGEGNIFYTVLSDSVSLANHHEK